MRLVLRSQGTQDHNGGLGLCAQTGALLYPERTEMIGREAERAALRKMLETLARGDGSDSLLLSGEPGIGKSRLVDWMFDMATREPDQSDSEGVRCVAGALRVQCSAEDEATPFHAMRSIVNCMLSDE